MSYPLITLYTPGINLDLARKADKYNPDAIIIDLEDTVPPDKKKEVRNEVAQLIPTLPNPPLIRVNNDEKYLEGDLKSVVIKNTRGILVPKAETTDNLRIIESVISKCEATQGLKKNSVKIILILESALGVMSCYELASFLPRIESVSFGSAEDGDLQADLGCTFSIDGPELLYARSRVILEARAAKLPYILDGAYSGVSDLDGLREDCRLSRSLGYDGRTLVHPGQIEVARSMYSISDEQVGYYQKVIREFELASKAGNASIKVDGKLVDYAMYNQAISLLKRFKPDLLET